MLTYNVKIVGKKKCEIGNKFSMKGQMESPLSTLLEEILGMVLTFMEVNDQMMLGMTCKDLAKAMYYGRSSAATRSISSDAATRHILFNAKPIHRRQFHINTRHLFEA